MSVIFDNAKPVTLKAVRSLYPGCLLEAYFSDSEEPINYIVIERPDAHATAWDIQVMRQDAWKNPKAPRQRPFKVDTLNTDRWTLLGEV